MFARLATSVLHPFGAPRVRRGSSTVAHTHNEPRSRSRQALQGLRDGLRRRVSAMPRYGP